MATQTTPITNLSASEGRKLTQYVHEGVRYATASNWKLQGLQPTANAVKTTKTTSQGYEFVVFAESQVEAYDANAELKKKEALAELKKQKTELFNAYMKHEVAEKDFTVRDAELTASIVALMAV